MADYIFEKFVSVASFIEMMNRRRPDFRAKNEVSNLKRRGIAAKFKMVDENTYRITAETSNVKEIKYLVLQRGFVRSDFLIKPKRFSDLVIAILKRPKNGKGGGIPLSRGEAAMLFLDGFAGDAPELLDVRARGYGDDKDWHGLTTEDVLVDLDTVFISAKWEPLELWTSKT